VFAVPGDLATPTGGYAYDRRVIAELRALGWTIDVLNLGDGFPALATAGEQPFTAKLAAAPRAPTVVDGLALGVLPRTARAIATTRPLIALVHHPLALETGLTETSADAYRASEQAALAAAHHVIATSHSTAELLASDYDVPTTKLSVAMPGTDRIDIAARAPPSTPHLLAVGAQVRRKGYELLLTALSRHLALPWQLTIVGAPRDPACAACIARMIGDLGLNDRVSLTGAVSDGELDRQFRRADLFVSASHFEGYGMAYADAIAHGLPVVGTAVGASMAVVTGAAGRLVAPGDVSALAEALADVLGSSSLLMQMAAAARTAADRLPRWRDCALAFQDVLERVA
jgi:glycosyltransferase involved in cell wall biosynthesis